MMPWMLLGVVVACSVSVGCASSAEIQNGANEHLAKAQYYGAHGDYYTAAKERQAADKQFAKAERRAYEERHYMYLF